MSFIQSLDREVYQDATIDTEDRYNTVHLQCNEYMYGKITFTNPYTINH
jgi:hypothetical protein